MPYGNFDDIDSLHNVYHYQLSIDNNLDLVEFIGEKILLAGFDPTEEQETPQTQSHPISAGSIVHIQSGVLSQPQQQILIVKTSSSIETVQSGTEIHFTVQDYQDNIFHPPLLS